MNYSRFAIGCNESLSDCVGLVTTRNVVWYMEQFCLGNISELSSNKGAIHGIKWHECQIRLPTYVIYEYGYMCVCLAYGMICMRPQYIML